MLIGVSLVETMPYFSKYDEEPDETKKTKFLIGAVDVMTRSAIADEATIWISTPAGMQMQNRASFRNHEMIRFGLKGVENYKNAAGGDIPLTFETRIISGKPYEVVSDAFLKTLPGLVIEELANKITEINTATDENRKK